MEIHMNIDKEFVVSYLALRLEHIIAQSDGKQTVLWGSGKHSIFLMENIPLKILSGINLIVDDACSSPDTFYNIKRMNPTSMSWNDVGSVIISSDLNWELLYNRASACVPGNIPIYNLYDGLPIEKICNAKFVEKPPAVSWLPEKPFNFVNNPENPFTNLVQMSWLKAYWDSAVFAEEHLFKSKDMVNQFPLLAYALGNAPKKGLILEFGVREGATLRYIAQKADGKPVYGFDSFEGLPEDWRYDAKKGKFSLNGALPKGLPDNVSLVKGFFDKSLPAFIKEHTEDCAFLHIDSDLYSSAKTILNVLSKQIVPGTVIVFDEYYRYPTWREHEYKAFMEFIKEDKKEFEYLGFASSWFSVAVRITG